jgi:tungstate transport system permease protein
MTDFSDAAALAATLILGGDATLLGTIGLSLAVSLSAVAAATLLGLPLGALVALARFPGRGVVVMLLNSAMGLPPVVIGLTIYLLLSRSGPLGGLGLLFTPAAMVVAQTVLVLPIIAALARQAVTDLWEEYGELLRSLGCGPLASMPTLLWEARYRLATVFLAGFGRAIAEVGAVMIVGGNIAGVTRTMTTTIALETGRGNLALALALGVVLIGLGIVVNGAVQAIGALAQRGGG